MTALAHYGNQNIKATNVAPLNNVTAYNDYSFALNKDFDGLVLSGTVTTTDYAKRGNKVVENLNGSGSKNLSGSTFILGLKKNF